MPIRPRPNAPVTTAGSPSLMRETTEARLVSIPFSSKSIRPAIDAPSKSGGFVSAADFTKFVHAAGMTAWDFQVQFV